MICREESDHEMRTDAGQASLGAGGAGSLGGNGHLEARQATVEVSRGSAPAVERRLWLPDVDLSVHEVAPMTLRSVS